MSLPLPRTSPPSDDQLDAVFHALSHRSRRQMLARLTEGEATVSELAEPLGVSLPTVSKHLDVLESAGLLQRTRDGRMRRCSLRPEGLEAADAWVATYRVFWDDTLASLAAFVEQESP